MLRLWLADLIIWLGWRKRKILTLGSVHLDTIAMRHLPENNTLRNSTDEAFCGGSIIHSIGGCAYNVAVNLARYKPNRKHIKVAVYTILPKHSIITNEILNKLEKLNVYTDYMCIEDSYKNNKVQGGGYVAITDGDGPEVRMAVIDAPLRAEHFSENEDDHDRDARLRSAIEWADYLVADVNLGSTVVDRISEHAQTEEKPLFVSLGSSDEEARVNWLKGKVKKQVVCVAGHLKIICSLLQRKDSQRVLGNGPKDIKLSDVNLICEELQARHVLCHYPSGAFALLAQRETNPQVYDIKPPKDAKHVGIVDAALAGFISTYSYYTRQMGRKRGIKAFEESDLKKLVEDHLQGDIAGIIRITATSKAATAGSIISFVEDPKEQRRLAILRFVNNALSKIPVISKVATALFSVLVAVSIIHQHWSYVSYWAEYISRGQH
jgi:sugar/nucleoside kinase (ribokinase family)